MFNPLSCQFHPHLLSYIAMIILSDSTSNVICIISVVNIITTAIDNDWWHFAWCRRVNVPAFQCNINSNQRANTTTKQPEHHKAGSTLAEQKAISSYCHNLSNLWKSTRMVIADQHWVIYAYIIKTLMYYHADIAFLLALSTCIHIMSIAC